MYLFLDGDLFSFYILSALLATLSLSIYIYIYICVCVSIHESISFN